MLKRLENHKIDPRGISRIHSSFFFFGHRYQIHSDRNFCFFRFSLSFFLVNSFTLYLMNIIARCSPLDDTRSACNCRRMYKMPAVPTVRWTNDPNLLFLPTNAMIHWTLFWCARRFFHHNTNAPYSNDQMVLWMKLSIRLMHEHSTITGYQSIYLRYIIASIRLDHFWKTYDCDILQLLKHQPFELILHSFRNC